jgi:acetyltransferase-like isoleucine patch superfamily enzyme
MWDKLKRFWRAPFFNKLHSLSTFYYKLKGILLYRFVFKEFGKGSYIRRPLLIVNPRFVSIGEKVGIREGVRLEVVHDNKQRTPNLRVGNGSSIEQSVHIVCHSSIRIGENVAISANCCILDVTHPYDNIYDPVPIIARIQDDDSFVEIGDGSLIGYGTVILPNVRIGKRVVIGSNSVVNRDIPDYSVAAGSPARIIKRYDPAAERWVKVHQYDGRG